MATDYSLGNLIPATVTATWSSALSATNDDVDSVDNVSSRLGIGKKPSFSEAEDFAGSPTDRQNSIISSTIASDQLGHNPSESTYLQLPNVFSSYSSSYKSASTTEKGLRQTTITDLSPMRAGDYGDSIDERDSKNPLLKWTRADQKATPDSPFYTGHQPPVPYSEGAMEDILRRSLAYSNGKLNPYRKLPHELPRSSNDEYSRGSSASSRRLL